MKVFLSWSGEPSHLVAMVLRDWLPAVLQAVEPWLSSEDIGSGSRWAVEISKALEESRVGILCLTADNLDSNWLNFEAGALSRLPSSQVCIFAVGVKPSEVTGPLAQFQVTESTKDDTFKLLKTLNEVLGPNGLAPDSLRRAFGRWWPELVGHLEGIAPAAARLAKPRQVEHMMEEALILLRGLAADQPPASEAAGPARSPMASRPQSKKPRVFIGSSVEGLEVAEMIQMGLEHYAECVIWNQGVFPIGSTVIESIVDASAEFDFAVIVLSADDLLLKRDVESATPRDNILFELGLFTGTLGRARTFMVYCRDEKLNLPSDVAGVTAATYPKRSDGNLEAALGPVCTRMKRAMGVG